MGMGIVILGTSLYGNIWHLLTALFSLLFAEIYKIFFQNIFSGK